MEKGVKEIGEAIEGFMVLTLILVEVGHDGFQMKDFAYLWRRLNDIPTQEKLRMAWTDISKVKGEAADLSADEMFEIITARILPYVPKMITVFKKGA